MVRKAALAAGMSRMTMLRRIVLPSAFRRALPVYSNEIIFMLHGSALARVITLINITGAARYYSPYEAFLTAAVIYMAITLIIVFFIKKLGKRWRTHLQPQSIDQQAVEAPT